MSKIFFSVAALFAIFARSSLAITYAPNCNAHLSTIKAGVLEGQAMANHAVQLLAGEDPFADHVHNPFEKPWEAIRQALFGTEQTTKESDIISLYRQIAGTNDLTIWCDEPPQTIAKRDECGRCQPYSGNGDNYLDAFRMNLVDSPNRDEHQAYVDDKACGYSDGNNLVFCPELLPGGQRKWGLLSDKTPKAGDSIEEFKSTYASTIVHEFTHLYGGEDFTPTDYSYGYGFAAAVKIASDAEAGKNENKPSKGPAIPLKNCDTFAFFALTLSQTSNPHMDQFSWVTGNAESYVVD